MWNSKLLYVIPKSQDYYFWCLHNEVWPYRFCTPAAGCSSGSELIRIVLVLVLHCSSHALLENPDGANNQTIREVGRRPGVCGRHAWQGVRPVQPVRRHRQPPVAMGGHHACTARHWAPIICASTVLCTPMSMCPSQLCGRPVYFICVVSGRPICEQQLWSVWSMVLKNVNATVPCHELASLRWVGAWQFGRNACFMRKL